MASYTVTPEVQPQELKPEGESPSTSKTFMKEVKSDEAAKDDTDSEENDTNSDSEDKGEASSSIDPYAYTKRDESYTTEVFKIEIKNLPKKFGIGVSIRYKLHNKIINIICLN